MYKTFTIVLEQLKSFTDNEKIVLAFEDAFNNSDTIQEALDNVEKYALKNASILQEITEATSIFKNALSKEELTRLVFITNLNGVDIDTRFINIGRLQQTLTSIGFNTQNNKYFLAENEQVFATDKDLVRFISKAIDKNLITDKIEIWIKEHYEDVDDYIKYITSFMTNQIRDYNQYKSVKYIGAPFDTEDSITFKNQVMTVRFTNILPVVPELAYDEKLLSDYKKHFPDFDMLLDFILASRFGADRKMAYIWFKAQSNWGKSWLFQAVLGALKLTTVITESELKKSYSGSASGFTVDMFIYSWILFIDEFKSAVSEIKNITHELSFNPKYEGQVTVPLYAKIFSSAENVKSLNHDGMVETQFKNRITFWNENGELTTRQLFNENKMLYTRVITTYVYEYLESRSLEYIELGEVEASNSANKKIESIIASKQVTTLSIEAVIKERISEFKQNFSSSYLSEFTFEYEGDIYVKNKSKVVAIFLEKYFDDEQHRILRYKDNDVLLDIVDSKRRSVRISGKPVSGYLWIKDFKNVTQHPNKQAVNSIHFSNIDKTALEILG